MGFYYDKCSLQGIPLAFVSTGRRPSTTIESLTLIESHNITKLNEPDFRHINQNAYPVVFAYNGRDHFAPTIPCTTSQFLEWKTKKELGSLLGASLHVSAQLDQHTLPPELSAAFKEVQACIAKNLPVISKAGLQHFKQLNVKHCSTHRGPAIQPSASGIPESSGQQDPSSAQSVPSTSEAHSTTEKERAEQALNVQNVVLLNIGSQTLKAISGPSMDWETPLFVTEAHVVANLIPLHHL